MTDRKPHVTVEQHYYLDYVMDYGPTTAQEFCDAFDVSYATAKRKLDGLVAQGKLKVAREGCPFPLTLYTEPII